jgi:hypothetical protein
MATWLSRLRPGFAVALLLSGCGGIHLYDAGKESAAKDVKEKYTKLDLPAVMSTETQNLDALLEEELAIVREARNLQLELALLRLVDDDDPIGATIAATVSRGGSSRAPSFSRRVTELGFVQPPPQPRFAAIPRLRAFLNSFDAQSNANEAVTLRDDLIYALVGRRAPPCGAPDFDGRISDLAQGIAAQKAEMLKVHVQSYKDACTKYRNALTAFGKALPTGEIRQTYEDWQAADKVLTSRRGTAERLEQELKTAIADYDAALAAQQAAASSERPTQVETAAARLREVLRAAGSASDGAGVPVLSESRVRAIDTVLIALSGGTVDEKTVADPAVQQAAIVAGQVPSLVGEIDTLVNSARAPAVSALVIEKQHQLLLRDDALRRVTLAAQRVALLETRFLALVAEARFLLAQHDGVCNVLQPADSLSRVNCDTLQITVVERKEIAVVEWKVTCSYEVGEGNSPSSSTNCAGLEITWGKGLRDGSPATKRALWESVAGLGGRLAIARPQQDDADYRLAHLTHLEVAASDEFAIRAWNELIRTPVNQLAAYHQTGIKPAELADLIIKAAGLGAIGIGVNR